jgi:uncharacterized membrane protein
MPFWDGWGTGAWFPLFPFGFIIMCIVFMLLMLGMCRGLGPWRGGPRLSALDILHERLAHGDIGRAEYDEKRSAIAG